MQKLREKLSSVKEMVIEQEDERLIFIKDWLKCFFKHFYLNEKFENNPDCEGCLKCECCRRLGDEIIMDLLHIRNKWLNLPMEKNDRYASYINSIREKEVKNGKRISCNVQGR